MKTSTSIKIGHQTLALSHLDKVYYPQTGFTKGQVIDYYARVAPVMLPHLRGRPLTLKRYPEGVEGDFFYEKECPRYHPPWLKTATIPRTDSDQSIHYCTLEDAASLLWVTNLASLELHILLSTYKNVQCPTFMAFDLDPGPGMNILDCAWAALQLREFFAALKMDSLAKTSGKKGIHVYVPLNDPKITFEETKTFSHAVALTLEKQHTDKLVSNMSKSLREKRILIDWSQNSAHKTTVAAYSLRANNRPTVSTPVTWAEIETAITKKDATRLEYTWDQVLKRIDKKGDLFEPVLKQRQKLPLLNTVEQSSKKSVRTSPAPSNRLLTEYRKKRDFKVTPEPEGGSGSLKGELRFVIQKHAASHLHYDFRLEAEGVLKSWAVPKGPSTHPGEKKLAMQVEDHPLDYANFEGIIPKGEYGGGTVMVWDQGTYINLTQHKGHLIPLSQGIARGHIDFWLQGKKLHGAWALVRMGQDARHWLLLKKADEGANYPPNPVRDLPDSAISQRTLEEIAEDREARVWRSNRAA
jgi:bifunctional non-homologous end joining protein LigD